MPSRPLLLLNRRVEELLLFDHAPHTLRLAASATDGNYTRCLIHYSQGALCLDCRTTHGCMWRKRLMRKVSWMLPFFFLSTKLIFAVGLLGHLCCVLSTPCRTWFHEGLLKWSDRDSEEVFRVYKMCTSAFFFFLFRGLHANNHARSKMISV